MSVCVCGASPDLCCQEAVLQLIVSLICSMETTQDDNKDKACLAPLHYEIANKMIKRLI